MLKAQALTFLMLVSAVTLAACAASPRADLDSVGKRLASWRVAGADFPSYRLAGGQRTDKDAGAWTAEDREGRIMKATRISAGAEARDVLHERLMMVRSVYEDRRAAYFSTLSQKIYCPEKFKPREMATKSGHFLAAFANRRQTYGACQEDIVRYKVFLHFLQCGGGLIQVETFIPIETLNSEDERSVLALHCES